MTGFLSKNALDARVVGKELWRVNKPTLQNAGFDSFTSRTARRFSPDRIDVVCFQSFSRYIADRVGCTTYSFAVRLGCLYRFVPESCRIPRKGAVEMPEEYHCHIRATVMKPLTQRECKRADIWYVDPKGIYLPTIATAVDERIRAFVLPWFDRFAGMQETLRTLKEDAESDETFGFGKNPSPARSFLRAYIAKRLSLDTVAIADLQAAIRSNCFPAVTPQMQSDLEELLGSQ